MALPTKLVAWNYSLLNRVLYTSLVQVMRDTMFLIVKRLIAEGYVVKGSCDGTTGAMDGVDRWTTAADAGTRFSGAGAMSWFVLTDANGYDICFSFNAAVDHVYRFAVAFNGDYVAAGTPAQQPTTPTTETLVNTFYTTSAPTIIGTTASLDRIVSVWTRPDAKGFRVAIARSGSWESAFGLDMHSPAVYGTGITVCLAYAFYMNTPSATASYPHAANNTATVASNQQLRFVTQRPNSVGLDLARSSEFIGPNGGNAASFANNRATPMDLQGGVDFWISRVGLYSVTPSHTGRIGSMIDWWVGRVTGSSAGDMYGNKELVQIGGAGSGWVWPWDGTPTVTGTAISMY